jgi:hypothetical protein
MYIEWKVKEGREEIWHTEYFSRGEPRKPKTAWEWDLLYLCLLSLSLELQKLQGLYYLQDSFLNIVNLRAY